MIDILKSIDKKVDVVKNFYSISMTPSSNEISLQGHFSDELEELIQGNIPGVHFKDEKIGNNKVTYKRAKLLFEGVNLRLILTK